MDVSIYLLFAYFPPKNRIDRARITRCALDPTEANLSGTAASLTVF
jgi:hypothetical protein